MTEIKLNTLKNKQYLIMPVTTDEINDFWGKQASLVSWYKKWDNVSILDDNNKTIWFEGAMCNTCFNALDRHILDNNGNKTAIIYESPITNSNTEYISYSLLLKRVKRIASVLVRFGVKKGDSVIIYMPMIPEAVIGILACARIGAIHSVVFGGFAASELAKRIRHSEAKVVLSASCGIEPSGVINYKKNLSDAINKVPNQVSACLVLQRKEFKAKLNDGIDKDWLEEENSKLNNLQVVEKCTPVKSSDPLYILYTSGTTGKPKGVVRDNGGHMVSLLWSLKSIYNINKNDVFWTASDIGWVVGHSYIVYAPLLLGCTTIIFEGKPVGTPDAGVFWRTIEKHNVKALFTAPTALRAIIRKDPQGKEILKSDISSLKTLFLAGERSDPETLNWAKQHLKVPAIDHWWQTETGWAICANLIGEKPWEIGLGSAGKAMPGYNISILNDNGEEVKNGELGAVCIKMPLPPGCFNSLWKDEKTYYDKYLKNFKGFYETGDAGYINDDGCVFVMSRTDDIINTAGHRLSTGLLEEVVLTHPAIAECAVFGIKNKLKGQVPCCLYVKKDGFAENNLSNEIKSLIRLKIGAVASLELAFSVNRLPKTRSGKILRSTMSKIIGGESWSLPVTVDDPKIFSEISDAAQLAISEKG